MAGSTAERIGCRVEKDHLVFLFCLFNELVDSLRFNQIGRVRRHGPSGNEEKVVKTRGDHDFIQADLSHEHVRDPSDRFPPFVVPEKDIRKARRGWHSEDPGEHGFPEVRTDQKGPHSRLGHGDGQIERNQGLPLLGGSARDRQGPHLLLRVFEMDVRPQGPETFSHHRLRHKMGNEIDRLFHRMVLDSARISLLDVVLYDPEVHMGNHPEHRDSESLLHVFNGSKGRIEGLDDKGDDQAKNNPDNDTHRSCRSGPRRVDGSCGQERRFHDVHFFRFF